MLPLPCPALMVDITNQPLLFFLLNLKFLLNAVLQAATINSLELARKIEGHPRTKLDLIIVWTGVEEGQAQGGTQGQCHCASESSFPLSCPGEQEEPRETAQIPPLVWGGDPSRGSELCSRSVLKVSGLVTTPG